MAASRGETWHWQNLQKVKEQHRDQACAVWSVYIWTCTQLTTKKDNINMHNVTPVQLLHWDWGAIVSRQNTGCYLYLDVKHRWDSSILVWYEFLFKWAGLVSDSFHLCFLGLMWGKKCFLFFFLIKKKMSWWEVEYFFGWLKENFSSVESGRNAW